jgi:hypothetical protein
MQMLTGPAVALAVFIVAIIVVNKAIKLCRNGGAGHRAGRVPPSARGEARFVVPFVDRVAYRHDLRGPARRAIESAS